MVKKKIISLILVVMAIFTLTQTCFVYGGDEREHDRDLGEVLFGEEYKSAENKERFSHLTSAAYLAIDQFNYSGNANSKDNRAFNELSELHEGGIFGFFNIIWPITSVEQINIKSNSRHRKYTHKSWDYGYKQYEGECVAYEEEENCNKWNGGKYNRKEILLKTVNYEMGGHSIFGYSEKCEALSSLIYYVHILGDVVEGSYESVSRDIMILSTDVKGNPSILSELLEDIDILFKDQNTNKMKAELRTIKRSVDAIVTPKNPTYFSEKDMEAYQKYGEEVLKTLKKYVPQLVKEAKLFAS